MRAVFIRHGQSTGNAGIPCHDLALIELTELGRLQAREVATNWTERPSLIVTSPYVRARQTAEPTIERFSDIPVEVWPIQEFTYLQPSRWNGTLTKDRKPHIDRYWGTADPQYADGKGAESFSVLLHRAEAALKRLQAMPDDAVVYLFSHGQFIQALNLLVRYEGMTEGEIMRIFPNYDREHPIGNGDLLMLKREQEGGFEVEGSRYLDLPVQA